MTLRLVVNLSKIADAFEVGSPDMEISHVLDLETGEVIMTSDEDLSLAEALVEAMDLARDKEPSREQFEAQFKISGRPAWQLDPAWEALQIATWFGLRYKPIEPRDSHEGWEEMAEFVDTLGAGKQRERLSEIVQGSRPFRRFKDYVFDDDSLASRWYAFQRQRLLEAAKEWLEEEDIDADLALWPRDLAHASRTV